MLISPEDCSLSVSEKHRKWFGLEKNLVQKNVENIHSICVYEKIGAELFVYYSI